MIQNHAASADKIIRSNATNDIFAKFLGAENFKFRYTVTKTASFDPQSRTIYMPLWDVSDTISTMIRIHEVGHALFSPNFDVHSIEDETLREKIKGVRGKLHFSANLRHYINMVEDCRIERLVSNAYPGTKRILIAGHVALFKEGFYGEMNKATLNMFVNRALLKIRLGINVPFVLSFNEAEAEFLRRLDETVTFDDVVDLAVDMMLHDKALQEAEPPKPKKSQEPKKTPKPEPEESNDDEMNESSEDESDADGDDSSDQDGTGEGDESSDEMPCNQESGESSPETGKEDSEGTPNGSSSDEGESETEESIPGSGSEGSAKNPEVNPNGPADNLDKKFREKLEEQRVFSAYLIPMQRTSHATEVLNLQKGMSRAKPSFLTT